MHTVTERPWKWRIGRSNSVNKAQIDTIYVWFSNQSATMGLHNIRWPRKWLCLCAPHVIFIISETLLAKSAMEKIMAQFGRTIHHYDVDNRIISDNYFSSAIKEKDQKLTLCGVRAHHQNGIIENKNKVLTIGARTLILNVIIMWLQIIDEYFGSLTSKMFPKVFTVCKSTLKAERQNLFYMALKWEILWWNLTIRYFVQFTCSTPASRVLEAQAQKNGSWVCELDYALSTLRSTLAAWNLCGIKPYAQ